MSALQLPVRQGTPEWLDARRDVVGSSDIPVITGNSPYRSSLLDLWAVKTRLLEPEPVDPETQELFDLGHAMEPVIAERYVLKTKRPVRRARRMVRHPNLAWAAASLDRVSARKGERRIIELKWVPHRMWMDGPEPVPAYVQDQVQWQLYVTGWDVADVAVLNGSHVDVHEVGPDDAYQSNLLYLARYFRGYVESGERPPIDGSEATRRTLARMYPRDTLGLAEPTAELEALARSERAADAAFDAAKDDKERIRNVLRGVLEEHAGAEGDGWKISFRKSADSSKTETNWEAVASAYRLLLQAQIEDVELPEWLVELGGAVMRPGMWDAIESTHSRSVVKEGARPLLVRVKSEGDGKWS
ncbi:MAG TPA: YqaJ viral recombinase family protein [Dehalococcoidia bacterium]|jgi:putative phage-type endonuclease